MTISDNTKPVGLLYQNSEAMTDDEKILDRVDLRKLNPEKRFQEPHVDKEQFILLGMSPKESLAKDIAKLITDFQSRLKALVNDTWDLMESDPEENSVDYADMQSALAGLIASNEKAKRIITSSKKRRSTF